MIFAILLGIIMALGGGTIQDAIIMIPLFIILRGVFDILFPRVPFVGYESNYVTYLEQLHKRGSMPARPWVSYLLQYIGYFLPLALVSYFITHWLSG